MAIDFKQMKTNYGDMEDAKFEETYGLKKSDVKGFVDKHAELNSDEMAKKIEEMADDTFESEYAIKKDAMKKLMGTKEDKKNMDKSSVPMLNFEELFKDCQDMDALEFKSKYGIEKEMGKNILDKMWLEKLCTMSGETRKQAELYSRKNFLKTLEGVEIFEPGYHNGQTFTDKDIKEIFEATKQAMEEYNLQPPVKLGHTMDQEVAKALFGNNIEATGNELKGMPALGWMKNLKMEAGKIVTDLINIPDKLYDMLKDKLYATRSIELWDGYTAGDGKNLGSVITGLALLGAEIPAVTTLANAFNANPKVTAFNTFADANKEKENQMSKPETPAVEPVKGSVADFDMSQFKSAEEVNARLIEYKKKADEGAESIKQLADFLKTSKKEKVDSFVKEMSKEGKLLPFQAEMLKPVLFELVEAKEVEYFDKNTELNKKAKIFDLVSNFIKSLPNQVNLKSLSRVGNGQKIETLHDAATNYAAEKKVSYSAAVRAVLKENPELAATDSKVQKGDN